MIYLRYGFLVFLEGLREAEAGSLLVVPCHFFPNNIYYLRNFEL